MRHGAEARGQVPDLARAIPARPVDLEMGRDRDEGGAGTLDGGDQADVAPVHALQVELVSLGARQVDDADLADRPARQDRHAEEPFLVLAIPRGLGVVVAADSGLEEQRRPAAVEAERAREIAGDVAVPGARHAEVDLVEEQDVGGLQHRMGEQRPLDLLVPVAVLDVPVDRQHALQRRGRGRRRLRVVAVHPREQTREAWLEILPGRRGTQRHDGRVAAERFGERLTLRLEVGVAFHAGSISGCVARAVTTS